jgi:polysaccharide biosynthesis/export protein
MRVTRFLIVFCALFCTSAMTAGCARQSVIGVPMSAAPAYGIDNVVYGSGYGSGGYGGIAAPSYGMAAAPAYAAAPAHPAVASGPIMAAPNYAAAPGYGGYPGMMAGVYPSMTQAAYAPQPPPQWPYQLDSGDRLRVVVFGQDGLTNSYLVDASGQIDMPLIGIVPAHGLTSDQLAARIADMLRQGFVREPHVAVEVEAYRPFFILGEVAEPGQYPYTPNMTVETAVAIAGGFGPRGDHHSVLISRNFGGQTYRFHTSATGPVQPGDTIQVQERWF